MQQGVKAGMLLGEGAGMCQAENARMLPGEGEKSRDALEGGKGLGCCQGRSRDAPGRGGGERLLCCRGKSREAPRAEGWDVPREGRKSHSCSRGRRLGCCRERSRAAPHHHLAAAQRQSAAPPPQPLRLHKQKAQASACPPQIKYQS